MVSRRNSASLLLSVLVAGALLAPTAHYAWMAGWAGAVGDETAHHGPSHGTTGQEHGHLPSSDAPDRENVTCDYSSLFATFAAAATGGVTLPTAEAGTTVVPVANVEAPSLEPRSGFSVRGPPAHISRA